MPCRVNGIVWAPCLGALVLPRVPSGSAPSVLRQNQRRLQLNQLASAERATVRLDSRRSVNAKLKNITWLASQTRSSSASSSTAVQLAGASAGGAEQPTMALGAFQFAAATNGLGASPFSLAPVLVANARAVSIPPMAWGRAGFPRCPVAFMKLWERQINAQDPSGFKQYGPDPHEYLVAKLFRTLTIIKKTNPHGHAFWAAEPSRCIPCFVCADGSPGQLPRARRQDV